MQLLVVAFKLCVGLFEGFAQFDKMQHAFFQGLPFFLGNDALHEVLPSEQTAPKPLMLGVRPGLRKPRRGVMRSIARVTMRRNDKQAAWWHMVDYDRVEQALDEAAVNAAEAHGVLAGMICAADGVPLSDWWSHIREDDEQVVVPAVLGQVHAETVTSLGEEKGGFDLMLPDDEEDLSDRAEALHAWCQGFLYGYGVAGGRDPAHLSEDAAEVLRDIGQFAQASFDLGEDAEEDELAYSELVEYLRVGVLLLHETLHPREEPERRNGSEEGKDVASFWSQSGGSRTLH